MMCHDQQPVPPRGGNVITIFFFHDPSTTSTFIGLSGGGVLLVTPTNNSKTLFVSLPILPNLRPTCADLNQTRPQRWRCKYSTHYSVYNFQETRTGT
jgi:hypothetical protein